MILLSFVNSRDKTYTDRNVVSEPSPVDIHRLKYSDKIDPPVTVDRPEYVDSVIPFASKTTERMENLVIHYVFYPGSGGDEGNLE